MDTKTIVICVVALLLGMLIANMLKDVCGCKNVVEGHGNTPVLEGEEVCYHGGPAFGLGKCRKYDACGGLFSCGTGLTCMYQDNYDPSLASRAVGRSYRDKNICIPSKGTGIWASITDDGKSDDFMNCLHRHGPLKARTPMANTYPGNVQIYPKINDNDLGGQGYCDPVYPDGCVGCGRGVEAGAVSNGDFTSKNTKVNCTDAGMVGCNNRTDIMCYNMDPSKIPWSIREEHCEQVCCPDDSVLTANVITDDSVLTANVIGPSDIAAAAKTAKNKRKRDKQKAIKKKKKEQVIVGELEKIRDLIARELVIELGAEATTILALKKWKRMAQRTATPKFRARICK